MNNKLVLVIVILAIATITLAYANMKVMNNPAGDDGTITFIWSDKTASLTFEEITALENHQFSAVEDTSTSGPKTRKYKGILLKDIFVKAGIEDSSLKSASKVLVKGLDGYVIAMTVEEAVSDHVYMAFEKDGKPLGTMKKGGSGPFQLIIVKDTFSQRWCKYVFEVSIE